MTTFKINFFWKIYLFNIVVILILMSIVYYATQTILPNISQENYLHIKKSSVNHLQEHLQVIEKEIDQMITQIKQNERFLGDQYGVLAEELEQVIEISPLIDGGTIADINGNILASFPQNIMNVQSLHERDYFQNALFSGDVYVSSAIEAKTNRLIMVIAIPLFKDEEVKRVVNVAIHIQDNDVFSSFIQHMTFGDGYIFIVDRNGKVIAHPDSNKVGVNLNHLPAINKIGQYKSGFIETINSSDVPIFATYQYIPEFEWGIVAQVPVESTLQEVQKAQEIIIYSSIGLVLLLSLVTWLYARRTAKPINDLYEAFDQMSKGNYEQQLDKPSLPEYKQLLQRFNVMATHIRDSQKLLEKKEAKLASQKEFLFHIIDMSPNFIYIVDKNGRLNLVNQSLAHLLNTTIEQLVGKNLSHLYPNKEELDRKMLENIQIMNENVSRFIKEDTFTDANGTTRWAQTMKIPINTDDEAQLLCIATEITERKKEEEKINYKAYYDELTGLPNRHKFNKLFPKILEDSRWIHLFFLDLDRFKEVNDSMGHSAGDRLLEIVAQRLQQTIRPEDVLSRLGGDEFTIIIPGITDEEAEGVAQRLLEVLEEPIMIDGQEVFITTSIGITSSKEYETTDEELLMYADMAMYAAKEKGKNTYSFFSETMASSLSHKMAISSKLRKALENDEFVLHYQPKVDIKSLKVVGLEALIRWNECELGLVPPNEFIPIAEETGLIIPITEWVIKEACQTNKEWQDKGMPQVQVAVNMSAKQFSTFNIVQVVNDALEETGLDGKWLELEITETIIMQNKEDISAILQEIKKLGVTVSIDDFGTGYSSLNYLKEFPIDTLKIDQSFIQDIKSEAENTEITSAIIALGHSIGLKVIAEGVETATQYKFLKAQQCDEIQGYLISKPVAKDDVPLLLEQTFNIMENPDFSFKKITSRFLNRFKDRNK